MSLVDQIMSVIALFIFIITNLVLFNFMIGSFLPRTVIRLKYKKINLMDRGIKKIISPNGRHIIYEPDLQIRRYIIQYTLFAQNDAKYIKCKLDPSIREIKYDVVSFDAGNKIIGITGAYETVIESGYTRTIGLPAETSYVSLVLRKANGQAVDKKKIAGYSPLSLILFALLTVCISVAETFILKSLVTSLLTITEFELHAYDVHPSMTFILAIIIGIICSGIIIISYIRKSSKVINK